MTAAAPTAWSCLTASIGECLRSTTHRRERVYGAENVYTRDMLEDALRLVSHGRWCEEPSHGSMYLAICFAWAGWDVAAVRGRIAAECEETRK